MDTRHSLVVILSVVLALQSWSEATSQDVKRPVTPAGNWVERTDAVSQTSATDEKTTSAPPCGCSESSCTGGCENLLSCNMCPRVYGSVEGLIMTRSAGHPSRTILIDGNTQAPLVSSSDFDFGWDGGVRALFGFRPCGFNRAIEFGYFGLFDEQATLDYQSTNQNVDTTLPGPLGVASNVFHDGVAVHMEYTSRLQGAEVNFPICCCWTCPDGAPAGSREWFVGFRYLSLRESLDIDGVKTVRTLDETAFYDTDSRNDLFGAQLGGRLRRCYGRFGWEATGKAGIFGNQAGQEQVLIDYPNFPLRPAVSGNGTSVAFVGELNLTGIYQLNNTWNLRAGYNAMWIEGVALAPDQLDFTLTSTSGTGLYTGGGLFLHGVNLGLEARW